LLLWLIEAEVFQLPQLHKHFNVVAHFIMNILVTILLGLTLTACGTKETTNALPNAKAGKYNHLAVDQQLKGNIDSALYFIDKAIEVDSAIYLYHVQRMTFLWGLNRNEEALVTAKKISRLLNYNNVSFEGNAYERLGDIDKARELYKQTVDSWPTKDLDDYNSRTEYSQLVTIVYGKEKGLGELNKIDESKLPEGQDKVIEYIRQSIKTYNGKGYFDFKYPERSSD
jgi:tetratricopeptide (TPR) repeat protein